MAKGKTKSRKYLIDGGNGDNPKLMAQSLSDGRDSLYLEFYLGYELAESANGREYKKARRSTERLGLYLWQAPRTTAERRQNRDTLEVAKRVRFERGQQMLENAGGYRLRKDIREINFLAWMRSYYEAYTKADKRHIKRAYTCFIDYLIDPECKSTPMPGWSKGDRAEAVRNMEHRAAVLKVRPQQLTKEMMASFAEYLQKRFRGDGPHTLFARFKKVIKAAVEADILQKNPCTGVVIKTDGNALKKDVLSLDEIRLLIDTHYQGENDNIRRAFIFCLYCGLRWCDVKDLTYANVDHSNRLLRFEQAKTKGRSAASGVIIPLNDGLLRLIGRGDRDDAIFPLPSHNMCLKALRHWTGRAGIDKHITWHCARHSFAVNILNNGANIKTVASLLGHSGLKHTEKYTRAVDSLKEAAINSLPELDL